MEEENKVVYDKAVPNENCYWLTEVLSEGPLDQAVRLVFMPCSMDMYFVPTYTHTQVVKFSHGEHNDRAQRGGCCARCDHKPGTSTGELAPTQLLRMCA